jgi:hypothetical protein
VTTQQLYLFIGDHKRQTRRWGTVWTAPQRRGLVAFLAFMAHSAPPLLSWGVQRRRHRATGGAGARRRNGVVGGKDTSYPGWVMGSG